MVITVIIRRTPSFVLDNVHIAVQSIAPVLVYAYLALRISSRVVEAVPVRKTPHLCARSLQTKRF